MKQTVFDRSGRANAWLSRAEIAAQAQISRTTIWRLANSANRDHLRETISRVERLHERVGGGEARVFHATQPGR